MFGTELMQDRSFGKPHAKGRGHPGPLLIGKGYCIGLLCKSNNPIFSSRLKMRGMENDLIRYLSS
jgi:hypothetical protein